jgi:hypothetical protein
VKQPVRRWRADREDLSRRIRDHDLLKLAGDLANAISDLPDDEHKWKLQRDLRNYLEAVLQDIEEEYSLSSLVAEARELLPSSDPVSRLVEGLTAVGLVNPDALRDELGSPDARWPIDGLAVLNDKWKLSDLSWRAGAG